MCNSVVGVGRGWNTMANETTQKEFEEFDNLTSREDVNEALRQGMLVRRMPPAPKASEYYGVNEDGWVWKKAGHKHWRNIPVEGVRERVDRTLEQNSKKSPHGLVAVDRDRVLSDQ